MVKAKFTLSLDEENVTRAKNLQKELVKADNLSGLVNTLLSDWVVNTSNFNKLVLTADNKFKNLNKTEGGASSSKSTPSSARLNESQ